MLQTLLSWAWIFISGYLWGIMGLRLLNGRGGKCKDVDVVLVFGLCVLTVYAQLFSLFSAVSFWAFALLGLGCIVISFLLREELGHIWRGYFRKRYIWLWLALVGILALAGAQLLTRGALQYDTYLYHAQSIRWIEEYGVAPGIGNLHNRLAYNSSFFCLQALYSFHFVSGDSMYSMNGFIAVFMLSYAVLSMKAFRKWGLFPSDFLRLGLIMYLVRENVAIASPGTDLPALTLTMYILIKWLDEWEKGEREELAYGLLCLFAVYVASIKLSGAMIVLLTVTPAVGLIRAKRWKEVGKYISAGVLIVLPWLIRNVLISGYLVYPYPELDLFHVDWKMPGYTLLFDRNEIKAWGWGLNDVYRFDTPMREWLPFWFGKLRTYEQILFGANVALFPLTLIWSMAKGIKSGDWHHLQIAGVIVGCNAMWLLGSPSMRYGGVFLLLLPLYTLGLCARKCKAKKLSIYAMRCAVGIFIGYGAYAWAKYGMQEDLWKSHQRAYTKYAVYDCESWQLEDGTTIYVPTSGDQAGYYDFPSTPYIQRLALIESRGSSLKDGFRMKEEYRDAFVTTYGEVMSENMFAK